MSMPCKPNRWCRQRLAISFIRFVQCCLAFLCLANGLINGRGLPLGLFVLA